MELAYYTPNFTSEETDFTVLDNGMSRVTQLVNTGTLIQTPAPGSSTHTPLDLTTALHCLQERGKAAVK